LPVSERCQTALKEPVTREVCLDFREIRRRVMCDSWRRVEEERLPFREAVRRSWDRAMEDCRGAGVHSPEPAEVEKAVEMLDREGKPAGSISLMSDGRVAFCHREIGCDTSEHPSPEAYYLAQAFFSGVYGYGMKPLEA
jgi:hypothetical protein